MPRRRIALLAALSALLTVALASGSPAAASKQKVKDPVVFLPSQIHVSGPVFKPVVVAGAGQQVKALATAGLVVERKGRKELRYEMRPGKAKIGAGETKALELRLPGSKDRRRVTTKKVIKALRHGADGTLYVEVELTGKAGASSRITPQARLTA
jgi:hypothetical protein